MKKILFLIVLSIIALNVPAQFTPEIVFSPVNGAVINSCIDTNIIMKADITVTSGTFDKSKAEFTWYFGDDKQESGLGTDSVAHFYTVAGGYYVLLRVKDEFGTIRFARKQIQIGLKPDFSQTKVNTDKSICKGDRVILSSNISSNQWESEFTDSLVLDEAFQIADNYPNYSRSITFFSFNENETIDDIADLKAIKLHIEHSNSADLEIKLKCPNETEITLKNYSAASAELGSPLGDPSFDPGTPSRYLWNNSPTYGSMNAESASYATLPQGSYASEDALTNLIGCPLNGEWTLTVTDNQATNNGFLFSWGVEFVASLAPPAWTYTNTYDKNSITWSGTGIGLPTNLTEGDSFTSTVFATPEEYGSTLYTLTVKNDFGCPCDTAINVQVSRPMFSYDPQGGEAPVEVTFTNNTEWGSTFEWDFGHVNATSFDENPIYTYRADSDTSYKILFKAISEAGCEDTVSQIIYIKVPNSEIDLPNVFTPNNDGNNDVWIIQPKAQEKELQDILVELDCRIYNRFGRMVCRFKTPEEAKNGWDGTLNNNGNIYVSEGIYYYVIKTKGKDGKELEEEFQRGVIHVYK